MQGWERSVRLVSVLVLLACAEVRGDNRQVRIVPHGSDNSNPNAAITSPAAPATFQAIAGKGVFVNISNHNGVVPGAFEAVSDDPLVAGVQVQVTWAQLEPQEGVYNWGPIDTILARCSSVGKKVALKFMAANGDVKSEGASPADVYQNTATPDWVFEHPAVWRVGRTQTEVGLLPGYPVFWDPAYQGFLSSFVEAFAARYDGDPRIEFIRPGGWQIGTNEPSFYGGATPYLVDQLAAYGMDVQVTPRGRVVLSPDGPYAQAVYEMIDMWYLAFSQTRLAVTIHFASSAGSFEAGMNSHVVGLGLTLLNTGLNEGDHTAARAQFRAWHDQHGCPVGWGGTTNLGSKLSQEDLEALPHSMILEMFLQGLGEDDHPDYLPESRVSYVVVGPELLDYTEELSWTVQHLVR